MPVNLESFIQGARGLREALSENPKIETQQLTGKGKGATEVLEHEFGRDSRCFGCKAAVEGYGTFDTVPMAGSGNTMHRPSRM